MMARRWVAGIAVVWVLASGLGLGYDRLHAQSREGPRHPGTPALHRQGLLRVSYGGGHWHAHRAGPPARGRTLSGSEPGAVAA
jgi:hypothetical protein